MSDKQEVMRQDAVAPSPMEYSHEQVDLIKRTVAAGTTDDELALFLHQAKRTGLDPLSRQMHMIVRGAGERRRATIQIGIDGFRAIADKTGLYAGADDYVFNDGRTVYQMMRDGMGQPDTATATVYKIAGGQRVPFTATVRWVEFYPGDKQGFMWTKMPFFMLGKCAEAQALRKAFPQELSGIYTNDEMAQAGPTIAGEVVDPKPAKDAPRASQGPSGASEEKHRGGEPFKKAAPPPPDGEYHVAITGADTFRAKDDLKNMGFRWNKDLKVWERSGVGEDTINNIRASFEGLDLTISVYDSKGVAVLSD